MVAKRAPLDLYQTGEGHAEQQARWRIHALRQALQQVDEGVRKGRRLNRILKFARLFLRRPRALAQVVRLLPRSRKNRRRLLFGSITVLLVGSVVAEFTLPPRDLPWHPLGIDDRAGYSTDLKLGVIGMGPASWCDRLIAKSDVLETTSLKSHDGEGGCGWSTAVHVDSSNGVTLNGKSSYAMRCPLAAGAHIWLTSVDYRAREILGTGLARVHHAGTFSCRRMYNRATGPMSEHAYANAWDVTGFELADGRVVSVLKHWNTQGPLQTFLRAARDDACKIFRVVLGPDYNKAHEDHLHVDMGGGLRCK